MNSPKALKNTARSYCKTGIGATIRLQFHREFTFDDAIAQLDYFAALGITHIYASPILTARQHSTHGYDIVDPTQISMELGGLEGLKRLVTALRQRDMGLIIDIVPNHMGVGGYENPWWQHVFEWGRQSPYAFWFDIDWLSTDPELHNKVLAPFLGEPYGTVLAKGDLILTFDEKDGRIKAQYFSHHFPIALSHYADILRGAESELLSGVIQKLELLNFKQAFSTIEDDFKQVLTDLQTLATDPLGRETIHQALQRYNQPDEASRAAMHKLLDKQHYRLTWWRNAADEINWRRFFEVCELAGVRVELDEVFEATHSLIFDLYESGLIDGLRLDHIDGLAHPQTYCQKLRQRLEALVPKRPAHLQHRPYLIAEKILASHEYLPESWGLDGTTGYDFMDQVSALLHDPRGNDPLTGLWKQVTHDPYDFAQHVRNAKRQLLSENLVGEFDATAAAIHRIARADLQSRDYSLAAIKRVLTEILVHFPVYRTYIPAQGPNPVDEEILTLTAAAARRTLSSVDKPLVDIILGWLRAELVIQHPNSKIADLSQRAMTRFQQLTPPLLAKSVEDTAFYRYGRLLSRNEVGSDPAVLSISQKIFHDICSIRQRRNPQSLLATATHDHKRGEDARMRIAVLSQIPHRWQEVVSQWMQHNAHFHQDIHPADNVDATYNAPRPHHEYMLYQSLVGSWPYELQLEDANGLKLYAERLNEWFLKSVREAKRISNWMQANETYETVCSEFLFSIMNMQKNAAFLQSVYTFVQEIAATGAVNSLSQTVLRMTTPGVPDLYQSTDLWDFSLVDPDNRRPVDFNVRAWLLQGGDIASYDSSHGKVLTAKTHLKNSDVITKLQHWRNGAVKQHIIHRALNLRRQYQELFCAGDYTPLEITGPRAAHVLAFMRSYRHQAVIVIVPRLTHAFTEHGEALGFAAHCWDNTLVHLPNMTNGELHEILADRSHHMYSGQIEVGKVLAQLPVAILLVRKQSGELQ